MSNKYDNLLSWAHAHGAIIPDTLIFPSEPYGHCRTSVPIVPGTHLFHIPHNILLTPAVATTGLPQLKDAPVHGRMCAFIALERGNNGFWKDYLDSLPETFMTPPYFDEKELDVLRGTNLSFAWRDRIQVWKQEFEDAHTIIPDLKWFIRLVSRLISREDYLWAATVLSSRSFPSRLMTTNTPSTEVCPSTNVSADVLSEAPIETPSNGHSDSSDPILIPVMDMLNHRPNHRVTWLTSLNTITCIAETSYPANTEVFNNYGAKGNEELLMGYGFCIADNPYESVSLKLPGDETVYSITRNDLAPKALVQIFCDKQVLTWRERLTTKGKKYLYDGYLLMIRALSAKLSALGGRDIHGKHPTMAARYAAMYRSSQRELLIRAYEHIVELMDSIIRSSKIISSNDVLRRSKRAKRRKKSEDLDEEMIDWLCRRIHLLYTNKNDEKISDDARTYLKSLLQTFYERVDWIFLDTLDNGIDNRDFAQYQQEKLEREGLDISLAKVRIAWEIWAFEQVEVVMFPDVRECFSLLRGKKLQEALSGQVVDVVLLRDELTDSELGVHWDPWVMMEAQEKEMNQ